MNRRNFLRTGSLTGVGLTAAGLGSLQASVHPLKELSTTDNFPSEDLEEITISLLQKKMEQGTATSVSITKAYLERIQKMDKQGPNLNSIIELNPDALAIAEKLDKERKQGKIRSTLHGIPVLVKDNINTGDKMMTTAGSVALAGNIAKEDAFIMHQLRNAGVVLLGKTNLSEWANFRSSRSASGWSSRGGQTKCPYILDRNPSGSSAGSGSATASNLCVVSVGTETDGSIVSPASVNGLVGIKPTVGLWSRSGIIPISATQDTAGPMARTVTDAAILLSHLTGVDQEDTATFKSKGKTQKDYSLFLTKDGLKGKRLGVEKSFFKGGNPDVIALLEKTIELLKENGATVVEVEILKKLSPAQKGEYTVLQYEFKDGLNKYLSKAN